MSVGRVCVWGGGVCGGVWGECVWGVSGCVWGGGGGGVGVCVGGMLLYIEV